MHRPTLALLLALAALPSAAGAAPDPLQWLLEQAHQGEALYRDDLVDNTLGRLQRIAPDDPRVLGIALRLAARRQDAARLEALAARLAEQAPASEEARQAQALLALARPEGQAQLQQARLAAMAGRREEALALYDQLFQGPPPTLELAIDYWRLQSALPGQRGRAIGALRALDERYPGNAFVRQLLVDLLLDDGQDAAALALLDELSRHQASATWAAQRTFDYLADQPVSEATARRWADFVERYPDGQLNREARGLLDRQRALLGDPAWQAGQRGLALVEQDQGAAAEAALRQALRRYPEDPALHGNLGLALMRQGKREEAAGHFAKARTLEQDTALISKWYDLERSNAYWLLLERADRALEAQRHDEARRLYAQAQTEQPGDVFPLLGLAKVAEARGEAGEAERHFQAARRLAPDNDTTLYGLLRLYRAQSEARALAFLDALAPAQQRRLAAQRDGLRLDGLKKDIESATERADWDAAVAAQEQARALAPDDPWLVYQLAGNLQRLARSAEADARFAELLARRGDDPVARYAHALFLSAADRDDEALASLAQLPRERWDADIQALAGRLERTRERRQVATLRDQGRAREARELLLARLERNGRQPDDLRQLAEWEQEAGNHTAALAYLDEALGKAPGDTALELDRIDSWLALGQKAQARRTLLTLKPVDQMTADEGRRMASAYAAVGDREHAAALFERLLAAQPGPDARLRRDAARAIAPRDPDRALALYAEALASQGVATGAPGDVAALTRATRREAGDDWLRGSLRSDVEALVQQRNTTVTAMRDYGWRNDDGTPGLSEVETTSERVHVETPLGQGRAFLRAERIDMDAGDFETEADGLHREDFGSCQLSGRRRDGSPLEDGCPGGSQRARGTLVAAGWQDERLKVDVGAGQGFPINNVYGGIGTKGGIGDFGVSGSVSRRPLSNSILSFAGARDPRTGIEWGAVTANGLTLGLSWDQGGPDGVWASLGQHWLVGENVEDNRRLSLMTGYYRNLISTVDRRLRTGVTLIHLRYDKDLSGYSLGQGGYWSPQRYFSIGVPLSYAWRNADWAASAEGRVAWSTSRSEDSRLYPLDSLNRELMARYALAEANLDDTVAGSSTRGFSYRVQGTLERRLSDHFVLGGALDWQYSEDYAPSRGALYLRYSALPWQGDLPLPPEPLAPYADF